MSLQVWLPLNGDLNNQGLSNVTVTNNGATVDNNGKIGKCYSFNSGKYITSTVDNTLFDTNEFSIAYWLKLPSNASGNTHTVTFAPKPGWLYNYFGMFVQSGTSSIVLTASDGINTINYSCKSSSLSLNTWNHIVGSYKNKKLYLYINGNLDKTFDLSFSITLNNCNNIGIGAAVNGNEYLNGCMNDIRIYNHCLSPLEVKQISQGLICHYKLSGVGGENLVSSSLINTTSYKYGFATRTVQIESGKQYTLSVKGYISEDAKNDGTTLKIYAYKSDWRYCPLILSISDIKETIVKGTFTANQTTALNITSYSYLQQNTAGSQVTVEWYKLEEGSKATPWCPALSDTLYSTLGYDDGIEYDSSGYGNNGTKVGTITWSGDSARYSGSYSLNKNGYIKIPSLTLDMNCVSFSYWMKITSFNNWQRIFDFSKATQGTDTTFLMAINDSKLYVAGRGDSGTELPDTPISTVYLNTWYHIVCTIINKTCSVYVNGVLTKQFTLNNVLGVVSFVNAYIGKSNWSADPLFDGKISDFRVYSTCLSNDEVKSLYNVSASIDKTGVLSAYEFVEEE